MTQGYGRTKGRDTINWMALDEISNIPQDQTVTYTRIGVKYCKQKEDPSRVCIAVDGNLIEYSDELTTRIADLTTSKVMWNNPISTTNDRYICADVKYLYLCTPLDRCE